MLIREKLMAFIAQQPPSRIVMKACGSANYYLRQIFGFGDEGIFIGVLYCSSDFGRMTFNSVSSDV
ncbi:hypothetical protein WH357_21845 [Enterobacter ludwigii]